VCSGFATAACKNKDLKCGKRILGIATRFRALAELPTPLWKEGRIHFKLLTAFLQARTTASVVMSNFL
jgi:hypothetical protein